MARLGMLYAITDDEFMSLKSQDGGVMYGFMLEHIEERYYGTRNACALNKAWEGIHFCLNGGEWVEEGGTAAKVIFGGTFLLDFDDHVITLKNPEDVRGIVEYLNGVDLPQIIRGNFAKIDPGAYSLPKDEDNLGFLLGWSEGIGAFYEDALREGRNVIFAVDL